MGRPNQAHTMGTIPCWMTSFPPAEKKKGPTVELYFSIQIYPPGLSRRRALFCKKKEKIKER